MVRSLNQVVTHPQFERFIRVGLLIRGFIYVLLGIFTLEYALGLSVEAVDLSGVIRKLYHDSASLSSMYLIAAGLLAYSLWGLIRAIYDPYDKGRGISGYAARLGYIISAIAYGWLSATTFRLLFKMPDLPAAPLDIPSSTGRISTGLGVLWLIAALGQLTHAVSHNYTRELNLTAVSASLRNIYVFFGFIGLIGRTLVFGVMSIFFIRAGLLIGTTQPSSMDQIFSTLHFLPVGNFLLMLIAFGLIAFGVYSFLAGFLQKYVSPAVEIYEYDQQHAA